MFEDLKNKLASATTSYNTKSNNSTSKDFVSSTYSKRYPNITSKIGDIFPYGKYDPETKDFTGSYNDIEMQLDNFTKRDSAIFTPVLDKLEAYLKNNSLTTETEKNNRDNLNWIITEMTNFKNPEYNESHKFVNESLSKLTDEEIKKLFNTDFFKLKISDALKLKPKNLSLLQYLKLGKYFLSKKSSDDYPGISFTIEGLINKNNTGHWN